MILSPFMRNWPWFLEVTRDLTILSHLSSVKGIFADGGLGYRLFILIPST